MPTKTRKKKGQTLINKKPIKPRLLKQKSYPIKKKNEEATNQKK